MNSHSIVVNREALTENFVPEGIVGREGETRQIRHCLYPATQRRKPLHVWIHGGSGAGKTALARFMLSELKRKQGIEGAYVCCWQHHTLYKVVDALIEQLRILRAEQQDTAVMLGVENLSTWAHELVHAADHRLTNLKGAKWHKEIVAELGGAVLLECLGMEHDADLGGAFRYIQRHAEDAKMDTVRACVEVLDRVCNCVSLILDTAEDLQLKSAVV